MLTFLRRIRRSMIESGSARKYVVYAIGEIALVVIGILIALQINNWNEDRKQNNLQQFYLSSIIEELETNVDLYNSIIPNFHKRMETIEHFFATVNNKNSTKKDLQMATDSVITFVGITFFRRNVFDELNLSGDFKVFDPDLRKLISEHYNDLDNLVKSIDGDLKELERLRGEWHSSIDYAYSKGLKTTENISVKDWKSDLESIPFMKSTNFYAKRYFMMKATEDDFLYRIKITTKLIDKLKKKIN